MNEENLRKILSCFEVFPPFIDVLRAFGEKTTFEDDSYGEFCFHADTDSSLHGKQRRLRYLSLDSR